MAIHQSQAKHFIQQLASINLAIAAGLTNANVAAANTVSGLATAIEGLSVHVSHKNTLKDIARAVRLTGEAGVLSNALIAPLTTTAGLQALFTSAIGSAWGLTSTTVGKQVGALGS